MITKYIMFYKLQTYSRLFKKTSLTNLDKF